MTYSTWSQITLPNWSTAKYLLRCDLKMTVSPSFEGSRIQTCFFFNAFPLALILNPKVSALKYLYWLELEEKVGYYNSSFLFPLFQKCLQVCTRDPKKTYFLQKGNLIIDWYQFPQKNKIKKKKYIKQLEGDI